MGWTQHRQDRASPWSGKESSALPGHRLRLVGDEEYGRVLGAYRCLLPVGPRVELHLRGVVADALDHPGSLLRAQLAFGLMRDLGMATEIASRTAVAVEYFHTASLIFDDMPAMDDAVERRGRRCAHLVHGEAAATLGALALVNQGYALLWQVLGGLPPDRRLAASTLVASCLGVEGILNGQARDLHFPGGGGGAEEVLRVEEGKTAPLVRLTVVLPAVMAAAGEGLQGSLEQLSSLWARSYQVLDDFKDCLMSRSEAGKSTRRDRELGRPNLPALAGPEAALLRLVELLREARGVVSSAVAADRRWWRLERMQDLLESQAEEIEERLGVLACA